MILNIIHNECKIIIFVMNIFQTDYVIFIESKLLKWIICFIGCI